MRNHLAQFAYLQLLDVLTTLACLAHQSGESNPLIRLILHSAGSPALGLLVSKVIAVAIAAYCFKTGRLKVLWIVNLFYSGVIVWNLSALLIIHPPR